MEANVNGTTLFYTTSGSGRPLMMMHGGLGADHTYLKHWFNILSDTYTMIYYDHRGNGRSERPASLADVTHATWAADADALRAHLGYDKIILAGHSYGGFLAQEYAVRYGAHLDGLILLCTAPAFDYADLVVSNAKARATTPEVIAGVEEALSPDPVATDADFGRIMDTIGPLYFVNYDQEAAEASFKDAVWSAAAWNHVSANCMPVFNVLPDLGKITVPTLVVSGAHDWITPVREGGQRIAEAIPNARFVVYENSGHYPFIEEHDAFFTLLRDWLAAL